uniref:Uncharacterized protein n=1 Tax=Moniliophthora roreri TaxID=221103 RepID=A0A0W0EU29_MONRR
MELTNLMHNTVEHM